MSASSLAFVGLKSVQVISFYKITLQANINIETAGLTICHNHFYTSQNAEPCLHEKYSLESSVRLKFQPCPRTGQEDNLSSL